MTPARSGGALPLKNKTVAVVGLGTSGAAAAHFLNQKKARVFVTDAADSKDVLRRGQALRRRGIAVETGGHSEAFLEGTQLMVVSPGVPKTSLPLCYARRKKIPVISEIELAALFCPGKIVGVTGSNGKTTTCHLIYRMLRKAGKKAVLCGNVGPSFLGALKKVTPDTIVVLELSSFQLEDSPTLKPDVALILNVSPNHLDRHGTFQNYARAKENIFKNQTSREHLILNGRDPVVRRMARKAKSRILFFDGARPGFDATRLKLKGRHNLENAAAAALAARLMGAKPEAVQAALNTFKTLRHRIETVGKVEGIAFVDDSKSTTVDSTRAAVESLEGPIVLIAGGRDKGVTFSRIERLLESRVKMAVLYGEARHKIASSWKRFRRVKKEADFGLAVKKAYASARAGETVLLSPMCASFDQFHSYAERGDAFRRVFREIKEQWTR